MKYQVIGADKNTGKEVKGTVRAKNREEVERMASAKGILISEIHEIPDSLPPDVPAAPPSPAHVHRVTPPPPPVAQPVSIHVEHGPIEIHQKGASPLGIASMVICLLALLIAWVPFIGMLALPLAAIGILLAIIGFIISATGQKSGVGFPVAGGIMGVLAIVLVVASTGGTTAAINNAAAKSQATNQRGVTSAGATPPAKVNPVVPAQPDTPPPTFSAADVIAQYTANEVAADRNFKSKTFIVEGPIDKIGKDILNMPYVTLKHPDAASFRTVQCMFSKSDESRLANLSAGRQIKIQGTGAGMMGNVLLKDCQIVP